VLVRKPQKLIALFPAGSTQPQMSKCLDGARVFLCPEGLGKKRRDLFAAQIARLGGRLAPHPRGATHLVLEGAAEPPPGADGLLVSTNWLSECIKTGQKVSEDRFLVHKRAAEVGEPRPEAKVSRLEDNPREEVRPEEKPKTARDEMCNQLLLQELQKLANAYKNSGWCIFFQFYFLF